MSVPISVIILEDRSSDAELMAHELQRAGFDLTWERIDTEAGFLERLESHPDVILADYSLPGFTAMAMLRLLQDRGLDIPFIVVTGSLSEEESVECLKRGAADYLLKDRLQRLGPAVTRALHEKAMREEQRRAERALQESERRFRLLAENAQDVIYRFRVLPSIAIQYVSPSVTLITGHTPAELYAAPGLLAALVHPDDRGILDTIRTSPSALGEQLSVLRWIRQDGSIVWTEHRDVVVYGDGGNMVAIEGIARDVTERKEAEALLGKSQASLLEANQQLQHALADLKAAQEQTIHQERLRALGEMASGIAHDFNNALAPILGYSELLLVRPEDWDDQERRKAYLQLIMTGASDAAKVIGRLKAFARPDDEDETFQPIELTVLVEQVVALTQPRWKDQALLSGRTIHVQTLLQPIPAVTGHESEIREALTNLMFNAVDASSDGGTITVRTYLEDGKAIIEVSDTGAGMPEEVRNRCLEPFFSTKGEHGTGLGLPMVYGIVKRHGGTLDIASAPDQGTTIKLGLPIARPAQAAGHAPAPRSSTARLHVLVVDDEPHVLNVLEQYLLQDGHTVETATNGREGLERFRAGRFDLVMTDRAMPELVGDELATAIKREAPMTPVILITGFGGLMQAEGDKPPGVDLVVSKPIRLATLKEAIATVTVAPALPEESSRRDRRVSDAAIHVAAV